MLKVTVKRSACDQCRTKRVRCLRAPDSTAPCARCCHIGARCVTGAAGHPGRPPKQPGLPGSTTASVANTSSLELSSLEPSVYPHIPADAAAQEPLPDLWAAPGGFSDFFGSPSIGQDQLSGQAQLRGLFGAVEDFDAMPHMNGDSSTALDLDVDPLPDYGENVLPLAPLPQSPSTSGSLARFREGIDQGIVTIEAYYVDPSKVLQRCEDDNTSEDVENPAALLLTRTREFISIIQSLTPEDASHTQSEDALSTEIVLLILSSYLAFMRFFDSLFHRIYTFLCEVPPDMYKSTKVKSVLRIGGVSALQDIPLKVYAMGILDAIYSEVQILEHRMGIPAEYCISGHEAAVSIAAAPGIFSRADRAKLFWSVMAQGDVGSRRGSKSYAESARASIKDSMAFLDEEVSMVTVLPA